MKLFKDILEKALKPDHYILTPLYLEAIEDMREKIRYEDVLLKEINSCFEKKEGKEELLRKCELLVELQKSYSGFIHFINDNARFFELQIRREELIKELLETVNNLDE